MENITYAWYLGSYKPKAKPSDKVTKEYTKKGEIMQDKRFYTEC